MWLAEEKREDRLRDCYPWLTPAQIRAALSYYRLYPEEIDRRLEREAEWTRERVRRELPFSAPARSADSG